MPHMRGPHFQRDPCEILFFCAGQHSLLALHGLWIRQPGCFLLLAAAYDAKHSNFAAVNGSCPVTSSPQELAHKGLGEMRESESAMYGLCIPAERSFLHHGK